MKTFSLSAAVAEPFRLAFKRPLMTIAWGLVLLLPAMVMIAAMVPVFSELGAAGAFDPEMTSDASDPFADGSFATMMQFQLWNALSNLIQLFGLVLVTAAIIRAVFAERRGDAAAFLRLGMGEVHIALIGILVFVIGMFSVLVLFLLGMGVAFGLTQLGNPWRWLIGAGLFLSAGVAFVMLWGRLALLAPASIHYKGVALEQGWRLGRGQNLRLLALMLVLFVVAIGMALVMILLAFAVIAAVGGGLKAFADPAFLQDDAAVEAWFKGLMARPWPLIAGGAALLIPLAWFQGLNHLLFTAPYARAVMDLAAKPAPISTDAPAAAE